MEDRGIKDYFHFQLETFIPRGGLGADNIADIP